MVGAASEPASLSVNVAKTGTPPSVPTSTVVPSAVTGFWLSRGKSLMTSIEGGMSRMDGLKASRFTKPEFSGSVHCCSSIPGTKVDGSTMSHWSGKPASKLTTRDDPSNVAVRLVEETSVITKLWTAPAKTGVVTNPTIIATAKDNMILVFHSID